MTAPTLIRCQCGEMLIDDGGNSHYEGTTWLHYLTPDEKGGDPTDAAERTREAADATPGAGATKHAPVPERSEPRLIVLPWDVLASSNMRTGVTDPRRKVYKAALEAARAKVAVQVQAQGWEPFTGPVEARYCYHPPDRRADAHNFDKLLLDALEGPKGLPGVYANDRQVTLWNGELMPPDPDEPRVVVTVERRGAA